MHGSGNLHSFGSVTPFDACGFHDAVAAEWGQGHRGVVVGAETAHGGPLANAPQHGRPSERRIKALLTGVAVHGEAWGKVAAVMGLAQRDVSTSD
jgi:hypothetical protein